MKNPLTPAGIETATFRFVAQHFNYCATAVPNITKYHAQNTNKLQSNTFLIEINALHFINIKGFDFPLYSHCQGQTLLHSDDSNKCTDCSPP